MCHINQVMVGFIVVLVGFSTLSSASPAVTSDDKLLRIRITNDVNMENPSLMIHLTPNKDSGTHDTIIDVIREKAQIDSQTSLEEDPKVLARRSIFDSLFSSKKDNSDIERQAKQPHINPTRPHPQRKYENPFLAQNVVEPKSTRRGLSLSAPSFINQRTEAPFIADCQPSNSQPSTESSLQESNAPLINMVADLIRDLLKKYFLQNNSSTRRNLGTHELEAVASSEIAINPNNLGIDILQENN